MSRKWGVLASRHQPQRQRRRARLRHVGGGAPGQRVAQAGAEAYYRPWGFRNGQFVELFARGFATLHSEDGGVTGGDSF